MSNVLRVTVLLLVCAAFMSPALSVPAVRAASPTTRVKVFLVALQDAGQNGQKIGCDDSIIPVDVDIPSTRTPLRDALNKLFSLKQETIPPAEKGGLELTNTLHASTLKVVGISLNNGTLKVTLTGELSLAGECDDPRARAQIEDTALQYSTIESQPVTGVKVFINGKPLDSFFGQGSDQSKDQSQG